MHKLSQEAEVLEATTGDEAIAIAQSHPGLELAIIDLSMPGPNGLPLVKKLCELLPDTPVVILSATADRQHVLKSIDCGASGFVYKSLGKTVLEEAILMVLAGGVFIPPMDSCSAEEAPSVTSRQREILELLAKGQSNKEISPMDSCSAEEAPSVTSRQREILELLAKGQSNKEIANKLHISVNTIKNHLSKLYDQFSVSNRTQAVMKARELLAMELD
eukprot:TRINITY_DN7110_c0_g3_i1.p1 TRINITY_DN7110_c0_g3~~TRINITY_DN7110_c0_g3_i1.p1  ORF type:complete len:218 (+),score=34.48 TRINITY_DN7110_c0_g3_i1:103-756(+)